MLFSVESSVMSDGENGWTMYVGTAHSCQNMAHTSSERVCAETTHISPVQGNHNLPKESSVSTAAS